MNKVAFIIKVIHSHILADPDFNTVIVEVYNDSLDVVTHDNEDYIFETIGDVLLFDSLMRVDGEEIFSTKLEFLETIKSNASLGKRKINARNLNKDNIFRLTYKAINDFEDINDKLESSDFKVVYHLCEEHSCRIKRSLEYYLESVSKTTIELEDAEYEDYKEIICLE